MSHRVAVFVVPGQLGRHRESMNIPVPDVLNMQNLLRVRHRGRDVEVGDANYDVPFLPNTGQGGKLLVFCADTELKVMHDSVVSQLGVCDGTFEISK